MTVAGPTLVAPPAALLRQRWQVCWSSTVTTWTDPFRACSEGGPRHGRVRLVMAVELSGPAIAAVEAWLELPEGREIVLPRCAIPCACSYDGRLFHLDATRDGEVVLAMSLDVAAHRLLYARSALVHARGYGAGTFDPPALDGEG